MSLAARRFLAAFPTSYLCERSFSMMNHLKSKKRSKLNVEDQLRVSMSNYEPRIYDMVEKGRCRKSKEAQYADNSSADNSADSSADSSENSENDSCSEAETE